MSCSQSSLMIDAKLSTEAQVTMQSRHRLSIPLPGATSGSWDADSSGGGLPCALPPNRALKADSASCGPLVARLPALLPRSSDLCASSSAR